VRIPSFFTRRNRQQTTPRRSHATNNKRHTRKAFFEPLESRQLLAGDIVVTGFGVDAANNNQLNIYYNVSGSVDPFNIAIYASPDANGNVLQERFELRPGNTTPGPHTLPITPSFPDLQKDYYLIAKVDSDSQVAEDNENNNTKPFAGGIFLVNETTGKSVVHFHGTEMDQTASILTATTGQGGEKGVRNHYCFGESRLIR
jgi:hypothetical protein